MRVRGRLTTAAAGLTVALTMVASLSACMTVNGETAVVEALTEEEAQDALDRYVEISNEALADYDPERNAEAETGPKGAIRQAALSSARALSPAGNPDFAPLQVRQVEFYIPEQAGWPKYFLADVRTNRLQDARQLLVFTRSSVGQEWLVSYVAILPEQGVPEPAVDEGGHLEDLPTPAEGGESGLAVEPGELAQSYAEYLRTGQGPFAEGTFTSDVVAEREEANNSAAALTEFQDRPAEGAGNEAIAVRTEDGGALVLFATAHDQRTTVAEGETVQVPRELEPLMEGEARTALTLERVATQAAVIPPGEDAEISILTRDIGVVAATGE
ncbi:hypothetical protein RM780_04400 [Streptomyces sp. DSM 44917]|uniref:DUF8094 domain-containing protein n=1 Tax=Streptomyces boetiae TaxID=3075541 RepID=A0ABU2L4P4_9ACTN|nr:hypothetical protein [Streptomyces sp. DSM 44917]MDT0306203.1 hypothetical protein [Streptomyces sp. DSM 44917]